MLKIFFTGGMFQFLNAALGIYRIKYFLDIYGNTAMANIAVIISIWGLVQILTEDQRSLFRNKKINSRGAWRDLGRAFRANFKFKFLVLMLAISIISIVDGYYLSLKQLFLAFLVITGYLLTMITSIFMGKKEAQNKFIELNIKQTIFTIVNFVLFFPLVHFFSSTGFLLNTLITSNIVIFSLLERGVGTRAAQDVFLTDLQEQKSIVASKLYCYVLALQASTYVFDQFLITIFHSHLDVVEYSLIRRIGLVMTVSTLTLSPFFSRLGRTGLSGITDFRQKTIVMGIASSLAYYALSTVLIIEVLGAAPPNFGLYQFGMILLGLASIKTSASISSLSDDAQISIRFNTLKRLVPIFLISNCIGIAFLGGFFPLYLGSLFLLIYEKLVNNAYDKS